MPEWWEFAPGFGRTDRRRAERILRAQPLAMGRWRVVIIAVEAAMWEGQYRLPVRPSDPGEITLAVPWTAVVLRHELGHHLFFQGTPEDKARWRELWEQERDRLPIAGLRVREDAEEAFAECYAFRYRLKGPLRAAFRRWVGDETLVRHRGLRSSMRRGAGRQLALAFE